MSIGDVTRLFALDPEALRCPYPYFDRVRDEPAGGLRPGDRVLAGEPLRRHRHVARDPQTFSSIMPTGPVLARQQTGAVAGPAGRRARAGHAAQAAARRYEGAAVGRPSRPRAPAQAGQPGLHPAEGQGPGAPDHGGGQPARRRLRGPGSGGAGARLRRAAAPDHHRRVPRRGGRRAAPVQALVRRLRGRHRQPRHESRPAALAPAVPERVLRVLRREGGRAAGAAEARPDLRPGRGPDRRRAPAATTRSWPCSTSSSWPATRPPRS